MANCAIIVASAMQNAPRNACGTRVPEIGHDRNGDEDDYVLC